MQPYAAPAAPPRKPEGVGAAVWIVVILSAFLLWSGFGLLAAQAVSENLQAMQSQMASRMTPQVPPAEQERMLAFQHAIMAAARPDFAGPAGALGLVVGIAGIVCAVRLHKRRRDAVVWLSQVTIAIVVLEVISILQSLQVQRRIQPLMAEFMKAIPQGTHPEQTAQVQSFMNTAMSGVSILAVSFTLGWGLAKIVACLYARHAARKPAVQAWLAGEPGL